MKLLSATALLACCIGWVPLSSASMQQAVATCLDNDSATCAPAPSGKDVPAIENPATTDAMRHSMKTPATFDAAAKTPETDASATASTVATLALFGSALVILGFFHRNRTVHRQLG